MKARSEPTWPEERQPSVGEWVDWFLANDRAGQEEIAAMALGAFNDINRCLSSQTCWINR